MKSLIDQLQPIIEEIVADEDCYLVDLEYVREGKNWYLRVYADKEGRIDINDCVNINEKLSDALDAIEPDPFPNQYFLEVASPGAERPLKSLAEVKQAVGEYVHVDYFVHHAGELFHEGVLVSAEADQYLLDTKDKTRTVQLSIDPENIKLIRLAVKI